MTTPASGSGGQPSPTATTRGNRLPGASGGIGAGKKQQPKPPLAKSPTPTKRKAAKKPKRR